MYFDFFVNNKRLLNLLLRFFSNGIFINFVVILVMGKNVRCREVFFFRSVGF